MKIACEKCNKIMDSFFKNNYKAIKMSDDSVVLCNECYKKLQDWMYKEDVQKSGDK